MSLPWFDFASLVTAIGILCFFFHAVLYVPLNNCVVVARKNKTRVLHGSRYHIINPIVDEVVSYNWTYNRHVNDHPTDVIRGVNVRTNSFTVRMQSSRFTHPERGTLTVYHSLLLRVEDPVVAVTRNDDALQFIESGLDPILQRIISGIPADQLSASLTTIDATIRNDLEFSQLLQTVGMVCEKFWLESIDFEESHSQVAHAPELKTSL